MGFIPVELTTQILLMLPVRSVLRCRSVCKTWRNMIDEPEFAASLLDREIEMESHPGNRKQTRFFLCPPYYYKSDFPMYLVEQQQDSHTFNSTELPVSLPETTSRYLLSLTAVNGLFSIYDYRVHSFICNPFNGQFVMLPHLHYRDLGRGWMTLGLGYDKSNKVFKAVRMFVPYDKSSPTEAHVHTIIESNSSWKKLDNAPTVPRESSVAVSGHIHWLSYDSTSIMSFDLASEQFGFIPIPELGSFCQIHIMNFDGCLSLLVDGDANHFQLWIMKDYGVTKSWTKVVIPQPYLAKRVQPISLWKDGEILLLCNSRVLVSCNVESGEYTPLDVIGLPPRDNCTVFPCCGNLLSLQPASYLSY